jgi:hypothetical protein
VDKGMDAEHLPHNCNPTRAFRLCSTGAVFQPAYFLLVCEMVEAQKIILTSSIMWKKMHKINMKSALVHLYKISHRTQLLK